MNISINNFFRIIGLTIFVLLLSIVVTSYSLKETSYELNNLNTDKQNMSKYAHLLRKSSDELSKYARLYAVTANEEYKDIYYIILEIRRGDRQRPLGYENIYWDIFEPERSKRHPLGPKVSLNSILNKLPLDKYEMNILKEAEENSEELVNLEVEAFNAMVGLYKDKNNKYSLYDKKDQNRAIDILHSQEYLKAKEKIMLPIDDFLVYSKKRTATKINKLKETISSHVSLLFYLSILFIAVFITILYMISKKILRPISFLTELMHSFKNNRELTPNKKIFYDDEIGYMGEQFYAMKDNIVRDINILEMNDKKIKEYVSLLDNNVITSSTDLDGKITNVSTAFEHISGYKAKELIGNTHSMVKHDDMPKELYKDLWNTITKDQTWKGEIKNKTKNGGYYWVDATIYPIYDQNHKKVGYTAIRIDITDKKRVEVLLQESKLHEEKIQDYVKLIDKNIITSSTDLSGNITKVSEAFCKISGYSQDELIGQKHSIVRHPDMPDSTYKDLWESITNNRKWSGELKNLNKNGVGYWVDATIYPIFNHNGEKVGYTGIRIDKTDKKKVEELLITDALTGIYNRRYFNSMLPKSINRAKRDNKYFSFMIIDIDHFKQYNDTYGHQEGDEALIAVAKSIENSVHRANDLCFRLGGEEFGVIFESLNEKEALKFADSIRADVEKLQIEHKNNSASKYVTISAGLVTIKTNKDIDEDEIYKEADECLYAAKEDGRNKVEAKLNE